MKIVIVGGGLAGLAAALIIHEKLLNKENDSVVIYEMRPKEDIVKFRGAILTLRQDAIEKLRPFISDELFEGENPKVHIETYNASLPLVEDHCSVRIDHLLEALIHAAEKRNISINRMHKLTTFEKNNDATQTTAYFTNEKDELVLVQCDQLLLCPGYQGIKKILAKTEYNKPLELHATYTLGATVDIEHLNIDPKTISPIFFRPIYKQSFSKFDILKTYFWAALGYFDNISMGNFAVYLATLNTVGVVVTYPQEHHEFYSEKERQVDFLKKNLIQLKEKGEIFSYSWATNLRNKFNSANTVDYSWLNKVVEQINEENVQPIMAHASITLPDPKLYKNGVVIFGDGFITTPFYLGSEFNEHMNNFGLILEYLQKVKNAQSQDEKNALIPDFVEKLWKDYILYTAISKMRGFAFYLPTTDFVGNAFNHDGRRLNPLPPKSFPMTRKYLEELNLEKRHNWIPMPHNQHGALISQQIANEKRIDEYWQNTAVQRPIPKPTLTVQSGLCHSRFSLFSRVAMGAAAIGIAAGVYSLIKKP